MNQSQEANISCLCGSHQSRNVYTRNQPAIRQCLSCGLIFTSPRLSAAQREEGYNNNTLSHFTESVRDHAQEEAFAERIVAGIEKHTKGRTLLDIGCGTGSMLAVAAKHGWQAQGLDVNEHAVAHGISRGLKVKRGSLRSEKIAVNSIDIVTMIHSLEHEPNPLEALKQIHTILANDGLLFIVTPDIGSMFAKISASKWVHLKPAHLYYFTRKTLSALLDKAGFAIREYAIVTQTKSLTAVAGRIGRYSPKLSALSMKIIKRLSLERRSLTFALGDIMQVVAVKK